MPEPGPSRKVTVLFLLYNAERSVPALVQALAGQRDPSGRPQSDWLEAWFIDDLSKDGTAARVRDELRAQGDPPNWRLEAHSTNYGLSRTLNDALGRVQTPYALTCHCDVIFGRDDYVASLVELMEKNPRAAAITGQPALPRDGRSLPFAEKVNLAANLMDIFRANDSESLVPVGFAEGRCDIFRLEALRQVGFYDTTLKFAGEDQVLASRFRDAGYEVLQAPHLPYLLSVSSSQDSLGKLVRHARLFGRAHPYILLLNRRTTVGIASREAGRNRRSRMILRVNHILSVLAYLVALVALFDARWWVALAALLFIVIMKAALFRRHLHAIPMRLGERLAFFAFQPALDCSYFMGLLHGMWLLVAGTRPGKTIN